MPSQWGRGIGFQRMNLGGDTQTFSLQQEGGAGQGTDTVLLWEAERETEQGSEPAQCVRERLLQWSHGADSTGECWGQCGTQSSEEPHSGGKQPGVLAHKLPTAMS